MTEEQILTDFPDLTRDDIRNALAFRLASAAPAIFCSSTTPKRFGGRAGVDGGAHTFGSQRLGRPSFATTMHGA
jgi:hypothetical protein